MFSKEGFKKYLKHNAYRSYVYLDILSTLAKKVDINNPEETIKYILDNKDNNAKGYTNMFIKSLRVYYNFKNIDVELPKLLKVDEKVPDSITEEYFLENVIPMIDEEMFTEPLRVKTVLYFMFYTGVRKSELYYLRRKDIDLKERKAKIYGKKTVRERIVLFNKRTTKFLDEYFRYEREETGNAFNLEKGSVNYIFNKLKPFFKQDNVNFRPNLMRHSFATHLIRKGADVTIVSRLLGHSSIMSTMKYLNTNIDLLKENYDKLLGN